MHSSPLPLLPYASLNGPYCRACSTCCKLQQAERMQMLITLGGNSSSCSHGPSTRPGRAWLMRDRNTSCSHPTPAPHHPPASWWLWANPCRASQQSHRSSRGKAETHPWKPAIIILLFDYNAGRGCPGGRVAASPSNLLPACPPASIVFITLVYSSSWWGTGENLLHYWQHKKKQCSNAFVTL